MTTKINWRLSKLPTPDEVRELVKDKIITQDEAREILFNLEDDDTRDKKSLESEIKFLRDLVEKLSKNRSEIITTIREIQPIYKQYHWAQPYIQWCSTAGNSGGSLSSNGLAYSMTGAGHITSGINTLQLTSASATSGLAQIQNAMQDSQTASKFSDIKTF